MDIMERPTEDLVQSFRRIQQGKEKANQIALWRQAEIVFTLYQRGIAFRQLAEDLGISTEYVRQIVKTMEIFNDPEKRNPCLYFTHHLVVANKSKDPIYWLAKAAECKLSLSQLRHVIEAETVYRVREEEIKAGFQTQVNALLGEVSELKQTVKRLTNENANLQKAANVARRINVEKIVSEFTDIREQLANLVQINSYLSSNGGLDLEGVN